MAGGMLLLTVMLLRLPPVVAIPIHGIVQLVSNGSRAWFQRKNVSWRPVWRFTLPLLPAGFLGVSLARAVPSSVMLVAVGLFVLGTLFLPGLFKAITRPRGNPENGMLWGGALVGFVSPLVGATGSLLGPFVLALELAPQATIGTLAACQIFQHASKVALFGVTGFDFRAYTLPSLALCGAAVIGSAIGTRLLDRVDERTFKTWVRVALALMAAKVVVDGVSELLPR
jgi:uncharacterized membrane protein YfcA